MTDEPLGLPKGSVRAILALVLVATVCVAAVMKIDVPALVESLATAAAGYYIGTRSGA